MRFPLFRVLVREFFFTGLFNYVDFWEEMCYIRYVHI